MTNEKPLFSYRERLTPTTPTKVSLSEQLLRALQEENYEEAAKLRDAILELDSE